MTTWRMGSHDLDTWLITMVIVFVPYSWGCGYSPSKWPIFSWLINGGPRSDHHLQVPWEPILQVVSEVKHFEPQRMQSWQRGFFGGSQPSVRTSELQCGGPASHRPRLIDRHMVETNFIPQVGYQPEVANTLMPKFSRWKETLKYGKIVPVPIFFGEGFADPAFFGCGAREKEFAKGYDHEEMRNFTRRWNRVLRHEIGRGGAPKCDELGWVDVESFLIND